MKDRKVVKLEWMKRTIPLGPKVTNITEEEKIYDIENLSSTEL